jgi:hypothetical protein
MTRRETLALLCAFPLLGLPLRGLGTAMPRSVVLRWDWDPGSDGGSIDYFEVFVTNGDVAASESNSTVTRVGGALRSCEVPLPRDGGHVCQARVRAVNAQGGSALSAPIILSV